MVCRLETWGDLQNPKAECWQNSLLFLGKSVFVPGWPSTDLVRPTHTWRRICFTDQFTD